MELNDQLIDSVLDETIEAQPDMSLPNALWKNPKFRKFIASGLLNCNGELSVLVSGVLIFAANLGRRLASTAPVTGAETKAA